MEAAMSRRYDEQVEVRRGLVDGAEAPAQFLWHDRLFLVRSVLAHWVETGRWWRSAAAQAVHGVEAVGTADRPERPGGVLGVLDEGEREVWRVEAAAGRWSPPGVFDLAMDVVSGGWVLLRVHD
jgi:hypothetical protein